MSWHRTKVRLKLGALAGAAALSAIAPASAAVRVSGVDATSYPSVRLTLVSSKPVSRAPKVTENGRAVSGLRTENLGRAKSVVPS